MAAEPVVRLPRGAAAQLRGDMRRLGVARAARRWRSSAGDALRIAAGLVAHRSAVAAVLRRLLAEVET